MPIELKTRTQKCKTCRGDYQASFYQNVLAWSGDGPIPEYIIGSSLCPACRQKRDDAIEVQERDVRTLMLADRRRQWRSLCGTPPLFQSEGFSTFKKAKQPAAYAAAVDCADHFPLEFAPRYGSLMLSGSWGTGKTHLACSIAHRIIDRWQGEDIPCPVWIVSEPDFLRDIQATYGQQSNDHEHETEQRILKRAIYQQLLILDDVGKEKRRDLDFVQRIWFSVIDGRYKSMRPIVVTTNLTAAELKGHIGPASFERLMQMCRGPHGGWLELSGKSHRVEFKSV